MKNLLKEKILLEEPEDEVLPPAEPSEPIVVSSEPTEEDVLPEIKDNAISGLLTSQLTSIYGDIDNLKSVVTTIALESPEKQDVIDILNSIIDDRTVHIGMLEQALGLVDSKHADLVDTGKETATAIAGEPEANELDK